MANLTNTLFFLLATPLQLLGTLILLPFAYGAVRAAKHDDTYWFLEFEKLQEVLHYEEIFNGPDSPEALKARADIRHFARRAVKEKGWDRDDIRMYLNLGIITHSDLKGLHYNA